jgi:Rrf2 family protein
MKFITRETDYAVRALCCMATEPGQRMAVGDLCGETGVPQAYLRRILQNLAKAGILNSVRGKGGGFELAKPADQIMLTDIIDIFQSGMALTNCIFQKRVCSNESSCKLRRKVLDIEIYVKKELGSTSIASLL